MKYGAGLTLEQRLARVEQMMASTEYVDTADGLLIPKSILTERGDIITRGASAPQRLDLGAAGQHLTSDGTDVVWRSRLSMIDRRAAYSGGAIGTTAFGILSSGGLTYLTSIGSDSCLFYIDPADMGATNMLVDLRIWCQTWANPTDSTLTAFLLRVSTAGNAHSVGGTSAAFVTCQGNIINAQAQYVFPSTGAGTILAAEAGWYIIYFYHNVDPAQAITYGYELMGRPL